MIIAYQERYTNVFLNGAYCVSRVSIYPITLDGQNIEEKRLEIKAYFNNSYELFEKVFDLLADESVFYKKSELTRHPMIFYFGHTATFFINKLVSMKIIKDRINPHFESIFAVGVDEMDWDDTQASRYQWPSVDAVRSYRDEVKQVVNNLIDTMEFSLPIRDNSDMWIILMGIEHERIHIETSLVLHRQMPIEDIRPVDTFVLSFNRTKAPKNEMIDILGGEIQLGKNKEHNLYGWDNEYGEYKENISDFKTSKYLVSNGEFMEFVLDGGYRTKEYWSREGLEFLERSGVKHPHFWLQGERGFQYRALHTIIDMPMNWPVDVNALEAEAFCRYKSKKEGRVYKLPSEVEYAAIYKHAALKDIPFFDDKSANLNFSHYASSSAVDEFGFNGVYDVVGNVWQWSKRSIFGFKGFEVHPAYDDFSTPTFDDKHALIMGSSWASSGNLIMKYSRYAFRRHFFQNAGFRYVISENRDISEDIYEEDPVIATHCDFQYGKEDFSKKCVEIATRFVTKREKALELGCGTGRGSFELAKYFDAVEGVDFSVRFIGVGSKLKKDGFISFVTKEEGDIKVFKRVTLDALGFGEIKDRVEFWQGDAMNLKSIFSGYDLVMATNLIDRLYNPYRFLETIYQRINKGGILLLTSPYDWQEDVTPKELWLGGYYDKNGEAVRTFETLQKLLSEHFDFIHKEELSFMMPESARKYKYIISELSVWRRK